MPTVHATIYFVIGIRMWAARHKENISWFPLCLMRLRSYHYVPAMQCCVTVVT